MTRWSNSEKNVGALSAKWPKNAEDAPSYWRALHDTIDGVRAVMGMLDDQFEMIDQVSDLSPSGRAKRRAEKAASALAEIDENYAPLAKAANLVERRVAFAFTGERRRDKPDPVVSDTHDSSCSLCRADTFGGARIVAHHRTIICRASFLGRG